MGMIAVLGALRADIAPSRARFEERLEQSLDPSVAPLVVEFRLDLTGVWGHLLLAFSGNTYDGEKIPPDRLDGSGFGVWAVRGRHPIYPKPELTGSFFEVSLYYNDNEDVAAISAWLDAGPSPEFLSYFRAQHERYVDGLMKEGLSERDIRAYAGGTREEAPYLNHWERMRGFYGRAREGQLWVKSYIG